MEEDPNLFQDNNAENKKIKQKQKQKTKPKNKEKENDTFKTL